MNVAVTGARGFLGRDISRALRASGHGVIELVRRPAQIGDANPKERSYNLAEAPAPSLLDGVDVIVHCAFVRESSQDDAFRSNVEGTMALFELARARKIPLLFISSLSAIPEARSTYGRQKFELERRLAGDACIVRPGLIVGDGGLVRTLVETMRACRVVPLIDGGLQPIQCIWLADVSQIVVALIERRCPPLTMTVAVEPALTTATFVLDLRRSLGLRAAPVSIPYPIALTVARIIEATGRRSPLSVESLLGIRMSRLQPVEDVRPLGISLRSWMDQCAALASDLRVVRARR